MITQAAPAVEAPTASALIRRYFAAYESRERGSLEELLSDDFIFSSPVDDDISREEYFQRCWPNSEHIRAFHIEKLFGDGDEAFVAYEAESTDGARFRNTEFFTTRAGKITRVDVYFGSEDKASADEAEIRALIETTARACRAKDVNALMACYAPDVLAFDLINPLQYNGAEEVAKRAAQWFSSFEGPIEYEISDPGITTGGETAFCHSLNHVNGTTKDGQKIDMWWRSTLCCQKMDAHWIITHAHSSVPFDMESGEAALGLRP